MAGVSSVNQKMRSAARDLFFAGDTPGRLFLRARRRRNGWILFRGDMVPRLTPEVSLADRNRREKVGEAIATILTSHSARL